MICVFTSTSSLQRTSSWIRNSSDTTLFMYVRFWFFWCTSCYMMSFPMLFQRIWWWFLRRSLPFFTICLTCYRISSLFSSSVVERMNSSSCMLSWILPLKISIRSTITTIRIFISTEDRFNFYVFSMFVLNPFIVLFGNKNNKLFLNNWNMDIDTNKPQ